MPPLLSRFTALGLLAVSIWFAMALVVVPRLEAYRRNDAAIHNSGGAPRRVLHLAIGRRDVPPQFVERDHLTPELLRRSSPAMRYLLDIDGADPVVFGYPPLPKNPRVWTAAQIGEAGH